MIENRPEKLTKKFYRALLPRESAEETRPRRTPATGQFPSAQAPGALSLAQPAPPAREERGAAGRIELSDSRCYLNSELTWLDFNRRLLNEAAEERTPLLERLKFQAIVSSNLDRFFMERMAGLKRETEASPQRLDECRLSIRELEERRSVALLALGKRLERKGIVIQGYARLSKKEKRQLREIFYADIYPLLTPQTVGPAHPFPFLANLSLNVLATLRHPQSGELSLARVKVPVGEGVLRFLTIGEGDRFVPLEEVVIHNLDLLFPGMQLIDCELFRVTRAVASVAAGGQGDNLLAMLQAELKERAFAPVSRLEVGAGMSAEHRSLLAKELGVEAADVFEVSGLLATRDLSQIARLDRPELHDPPHDPLPHPLFACAANLFQVIREQGQILLQHPYICYASSVERFLREAARDPGVRAIKMTLYRTALAGGVVDSLLQAAENGKQVSVVVELKARFRESANIRLAGMLEEAGIHVSYGVLGLETHAKVLLVVREEEGRLRRYVHIGTGNYHAETARSYSDLGLLTCDDTIAQDISELFNYLTTGFTPWRKYRAVMPAPKLLKKALLTRIRREAQLRAEGRGGQIRFKVNRLDDLDVVKALYAASQAGVSVELYVRDGCRLRPGVPGLSENISVVSTVGRFLEHARIYHFENGGDDEYFLSSADPVKRSLESRVEILCPVSASSVVEELAAIFDLHRADRRSSWDMQPDGSYLQRRPAQGEPEDGLQQMMTARVESTCCELAHTVARRKIMRAR